MIPLLRQPFVFLRHGQTASNATGLIGGATDLPLTGTGREQAQAAARVLRDVPLASVWASPLLRARETAEIVARGLPLTLLEGLRERNWGIWEGRPRSMLVREDTPEGGEGPRVFRDRVRAAMAAIEGPFPALIVAHSGTAREIHAALSPAPFRRPANGEVSEWARTAKDWRNRLLSPKLRIEDLETREPFL